ncbi:MAG: hypothetical protein GY714_26780 [Desulfobacterales bacterium]|nr:hypothetical protein [Desulfobacterales bacterium]MCP4161946.1 hypothetical protein [Deltaproteobacteria bacterium]
MNQSQPVMSNDVEKCVDEIIKRVGKTIVFGMPLALGKSYHIVNELYRRAKEDPEINLTIMTALALEKPGWSSDLERRMLAPIVERIWKGVPDFDYMADLRAGILPKNVTVREFFCKAGGYINVAHAQQEYVSSNYTHAVRDIVLNGINVYCHAVAKKTIDGKVFYSDSCNSDMAELVDYCNENNILHVGHVNNELPFMFGDAVNISDRYDMILEGEQYHFPLFSIPKASITTQDYMIGLYVSTLIKDGGTLQIGIGSLGDAIACGLILRHTHNDIYKQILAESGIDKKYGNLINEVGGRDTFEEGLYGATEMFVEVFVKLYKAGIVKRKVFGNVAIQKLLNEGTLKEKITPEAVDSLLQEDFFSPVMTEEGFDILQKYGILRENLSFKDYRIVNGSSSWSVDFRDPENRKLLVENCLGDNLKNGVLLHGSFFIGSNGFYNELREMDDEERSMFEMTGVDTVNQLYGNERLRALQRKEARFVNAGMKLSILGNVCSDGLENGTVISGVGGQYNFVSMAHALPDGRLIMMIRSTKQKGADTLSNIVFNYGHTTVPRHLRDIIVTEYGIADLLGKSDKDVIASILNITDSRFQDDLLAKAKKSGKIPQEYKIPEIYRNNTPERLESKLESYRNNYFSPFPFGTDFTDQEIVIGKALRGLKTSLNTNKVGTIKGLIKQLIGKVPESSNVYLERMDLDITRSLKEKMMQKVVVYALKSSGGI